MRGLEVRSFKDNLWVAPALLLMLAAPRLLFADDVSAPPILQWFEASYNTIEKRTPDLFLAGYGAAYLPPPGRADSGNQSVGYDVYDRFDLGKGGNPTLYGTERGLKATVKALQKTGGSVFIDYVINHSGFRDSSTAGFVAQGDYPGFVTTLPQAVDGDYHSAFASDDIQMRLAGLIDIDQRTDFKFIRSPVPGFANNIPGGTVADIPDENNRRFYPDKSLAPIMVFDPKTGESNLAIYPFNNANPMAGDPVEENAMGYLMRYAQWMVQSVGVDGFRIDAAKHVYPFALNFFDRAVYRSSFRTNLDGSQRQVFSFQEAYSGDKAFLQTFIRKDINPANPGTVGGNRDVLDFPLFFALRDNLTSNGAVNNWHNIAGASVDSQDDGNANNGSQGVAFVISHDDGGPYMSNVAHAFVLMRPGNVNVYHNAHEFGTNRDFPKDGRGDALGGFYGNAITRLLSIRNSYGRGNFKERWLDDAFNPSGFSNVYVYERSNSAIVGLNSRNDAGYEQRAGVQTDFDAGTHLVELTGNAADPLVDPNGDIPDTLVVNSSKQITIRIPNNNGAVHGKGYVIYGPQRPQGTLSLTNVSQTIAGETPTANTNGTARLASIDVITGNSFQVQLNTTAMTLSDGFRDHDADGDNALLKIDDGFDANGNGVPDIPSPTSTHYGFENFLTFKSPGFNNANGNGSYQQTVNVANLSEGMHYLTVRAFRHRANGPAIFNDFKKVIYVDRLKPVSSIDGFDPIVGGLTQAHRLTVRNTDLTANNVHVFFNLPAALTDAQVLAMVNGSSQASHLDRDLWTMDVLNLPSGNYVATVVTYEMTGNSNVQRFPGLLVSGPYGGFGDLNFNSAYAPDDVTIFSNVFNSNNTQFNPSGDLDGDGRVGETDLLLLGPRYTAVNASASTKLAYNQLLINPGFGITRTVTALLDNSAGSGLSKAVSGTLNINGPQSHGVGASLSISAGTVNFNTDAGAAGPNLQLTVSNSALVNLPAVQHLKSLSVAGATVNATATLDTGSLSITGSGVLDLHDGQMIVRQGDLASIADSIRRARAGGAWNGFGLTSSAARADEQHLTTLGILLNEDGAGQPIYTSFAGQSVDASSILIRYTYTGDLDLDLDIDADDYAILDAGYANHAAGYQFGDINLDGAINADDFFLIDRAFSNQGLILSTLHTTSSVPEPSTILLAGFALLFVARASRP
jgi:alpha-amylase